MSIVIVEFTLPHGTTGEQLLAQDARISWCFEAHRVWPVIHCLSADGQTACCILDAPDAEAVRHVGRSGGLAPPDRLWAATVHGPVAGVEDPARQFAAAARAGVLAVVERSFAEPHRFEDVRPLEGGGASCLGLNRVEFLASYVSLDRRRMICFYAAPDVDALRRINVRLGLPFDRIWGAEPHFHEAPPPGIPAYGADGVISAARPPVTEGK
jgi:Protein of unknown function (DUF4242)